MIKKMNFNPGDWADTYVYPEDVVDGYLCWYGLRTYWELPEDPCAVTVCATNNVEQAHREAVKFRVDRDGHPHHRQNHHWLSGPVREQLRKLGPPEKPFHVWAWVLL